VNPFGATAAGRIQTIAESKTNKIFNLANQMRQQGRDIISLAVGEPDFDTPKPVIEATRAAVAAGETRYGPVAGLGALRQKLAEGFIDTAAENILITNGAKQALFSLFQVLCDPGTEVIVPAPCWVSFTEQVKLAGGSPVLVATPNHQLDPALIEKAVSQHTRAILINTPNNPTGAVYSVEALTAVARLAEKHGLYLIADEAYHVCCFDRPHVSIRDICRDHSHVITVRSFSKHYNMTGFRIGYVVADPEIIEALTKLQSHVTGNVCTFVQYGALAALEMDQGIVDQRRSALAKRRDLAFEQVSELFPCVKAQGAFYLFPDISQRLRPDQTSEDLAMTLLEETGVAVVPGDAFHGPGHIRISFAISEAKLNQAFERIRSIL
jgi:aspartate aminotransferase